MRWPLVVAAVPDARLCVVGFGEYRAGLERLALRWRAADLDDVREVARRGRELEGGEEARAAYLAAFLKRWEGEQRERGGRARPRRASHFTGRLEHDDLPDLLPACEAQVVPSTFPEAFGMVAVEAAACGRCRSRPPTRGWPR